MTACIIGWHHTRFGKRDDMDLESLICEATEGALEHAGVEAKDIDEVFVGHYNGGLWDEVFPSSLVHQVSADFRFKPTTTVENACATGTAAIYQGRRAIAAGAARHVLVVGVEKMTHNAPATINAALKRGSYMKEEADIPYAAAGAFAEISKRYFQRFGDKSDALAWIAAKNHRNGAKNPLAHFRKDLGYDFCRTVSEKNPMIASPLRRTDCSAVSDGAAAIVLCDVATALGAKLAVIFRAAQQVNDFKPMSRREMSELEGGALAWRRAYEEANISVNDLSCVECHDCFTIAELMQYEAMELTAIGGGDQAIKEGWTEKEGKLPVNVSGGLKAKGHPIGATGVSMHVMASMQLAGAAGELQIGNPKLAGVFNMGGYGVANYVSVLERLR